MYIFSKYIVLILCLSLYIPGHTQSFEKKFSGRNHYGNISISFFKDSTYFKYGGDASIWLLMIRGRYKMISNKIYILERTKDESESITDTYLLTKDSNLIHLKTNYVLKPAKVSYFGKVLNRTSPRIIPKINLDSQIHITQITFDSIVRSGITALKNDTTLLNIPDSTLVGICRVINTLYMREPFNDSLKMIDLYSEFLDQTDRIGFMKKMCTIHWYSYNRGMGYYFYELGIELMGTPHLFSMYTIRD